MKDSGRQSKAARTAGSRTKSVSKPSAAKGKPTPAKARAPATAKPPRAVSPASRGRAPRAAAPSGLGTLWIVFWALLGVDLTLLLYVILR